MMDKNTKELVLNILERLKLLPADDLRKELNKSKNSKYAKNFKLLFNIK